MKHFFILLFLGITNFCYSQNTSLSKFHSIVNSRQHDTLKCRLVSELIESELNDSLWPIYNSYLSDLSLKQSKNSKDLEKFYLGYYAYTLSNVGYQNMILGKTKLSYEFYKKALEIHKNTNNKKEIAYVLINLGYLYRQDGRIAEAIETYHQALRIQLEINDKLGAASSYNNIGFIFDNQSELKKALEYYDKALKLYSVVNDKDGIAIAYGNIAYIYSAIGDPECKGTKNYCLKQGVNKAIQLHNKAIVLKKELGDDIGVASCYNLLGGILDSYSSILCDGQSASCANEIINKANEYYLSALKIREKLNNLKGIVQSCNSLANFNYKHNDLSEAFKYALNGLDKARELGSPEEISDAALILKDIYKSKGQYEKALNMHELYLQMRDSVYNEGNRQIAIKKSYEIEYEKKAIADSVKVAEEKKVVQAQLDKEKTQRFALYGGLLLVIVFSGFMVNRFLVTNKQKQIIEIKEKETQHQNEIITEQKALVDEKQKEILDSINYAKRIQYTLLAHADFLKQYIPNHFVYFNPKDIVSGDFYWATKQDRYFYLAVCDSTGHGVPGAFMSLMNIGFLSEAINEKNILEPGEVFNYVRNRLINSISKEGQKDGFDGILLRLEIEDSTIKSASYAAANNAPIHIKNNELIELPKDKMPVGKGEKEDSFATHYLEVNQGETIYLYTDGFADQFGGPKGKKFKYKPLNEMLVANSSLELEKQKHELEQTFNTWKSDLEQVDDVLVVGVRI